MNKVYYTYNQIHEQVIQLAKKVQPFKPDYIIAIGGGGLIPARILRVFLNVPVLVVTLESYNDTERGELFKRQWIDNDQIVGKRVVIVDELNDTASTIVYCAEEIRKANPEAIAVAVVHDKEKEKESVLAKDIHYFVGSKVSDQWIVYPWEVEIPGAPFTNLSIYKQDDGVFCYPYSAFSC